LISASRLNASSAQSLRATADAVRGAWSTSAISPNTPPGESFDDLAADGHRHVAFQHDVHGGTGLPSFMIFTPSGKRTTVERSIFDCSASSVAASNSGSVLLLRCPRCRRAWRDAQPEPDALEHHAHEHEGELRLRSSAACVSVPSME
jgi:hypothetical protein